MSPTGKKQLGAVTGAALAVLNSQWRDLLSFQLPQGSDEGEWMDYLKLRIDPRRYCSEVGPPDVRRYARDACASSLFKKSVDLPVSVNRRGAAIAKWLEGERQCYQTNLRLTAYQRGQNPADRNERIMDFIHGVRKIIRSWLGVLPDIRDPSEDLRSGNKTPSVGDLHPRHGPGATFSDVGLLITSADKMTSSPQLTVQSATSVLPLWVGTMWAASTAKTGRSLLYVRGERYSTAPKKATEERSTCPQPSLLIWAQLGYGGAIRSRLKHRANWDLRKAQEIHKRVACESSADQRFGTVDLSNASETLSKGLVKLLLPRTWFEALNALRSPTCRFAGKDLALTGLTPTADGTDGSRHFVLEKFSAMGNGYTFELETLIFAALAVAITRQCGFPGHLGRDVFVYGDDIIVPDSVCPILGSVFAFFGLTLNKEKSFWGSVPFRESCGGDYLMGIPVRGVYMEEEPNEVTGMVSLANKVYRWSKTTGEALGCPLNRLWFALLDRIPSRMRSCRGPEWMGDMVLTDRDTARWSVSMRPVPGCAPDEKFLHIRVLEQVRQTLPWHHWSSDIQLACALIGYGDGLNGVTPRDGPFVVRERWAQASWDAGVEDLNQVLGRWSE